ncbi:MAG TPA: enoyl-CoA hydratase/isomerase family protein, partial [Burkholderiales bacterium]|nr:enoyl-CoA hydratase/isomerase family protein [Burkholderiales bacterium]
MRRPAAARMKGDRTTLRIEERPGEVLLATLDRPEVANAFDTGAALELCELFERFRTEQRYRCVVITGAGDRAFCAGADLKERESLSDEQWRSQHEVFERMFRAVRDCPVPA